MNDLFLKIINMSISASWLVLAAPVCLEESTQVGQCPALGHCGSASGFSVLYRERSESDPQRRDSSDGYRNGSTAHDQQRCSSDQ